MGFETWSFTLRVVKHRLRLLENTVQKRIFGSKRNEVVGGWKDCIMRSLITCRLHKILLR